MDDLVVAERYAKPNKQLILVGVNFDSTERKIVGWVAA